MIPCEQPYCARELDHDGPCRADPRPDETLHPDALELEVDRLRARVVELEREREGWTFLATKGIDAEREACARLADAEAKAGVAVFANATHTRIATKLAAAIRARGKPATD